MPRRRLIPTISFPRPLDVFEQHNSSEALSSLRSSISFEVDNDDTYHADDEQQSGFKSMNALNGFFRSMH